jgi:hypothetical protein
MRMHTATAIGMALAAAAALTVVAPTAALAGTGPSCELGGETSQHNVYYVQCEYVVTGNPVLTWSGIPIVSGQGTSEMKGTCIGDSEYYDIKVTWAGAPTPPPTTQFYCDPGHGQ